MIVPHWIYPCSCTLLLLQQRKPYYSTLSRSFVLLLSATIAAIVTRGGVARCVSSSSSLSSFVTRSQLQKVTIRITNNDSIRKKNVKLAQSVQPFNQNRINKLVSRIGDRSTTAKEAQPGDEDPLSALQRRYDEAGMMVDEASTFLLEASITLREATNALKKWKQDHPGFRESDDSFIRLTSEVNDAKENLNYADQRFVNAKENLNDAKHNLESEQQSLQKALPPLQPKNLQKRRIEWEVSTLAQLSNDDPFST
jgi:hypothetical protein